MTLDLNLILACAAVLAAAGSLIAILAHGKACDRKQEAAEAGIYHVRKTLEDRAGELKAELQAEFRQALAALEAGLQGPEHALAEGRMSRSNRAEALRLLRSGMAPETAAATLGMPRNDLELLAKVAGILAAG